MMCDRGKGGRTGDIASKKIDGRTPVKRKRGELAASAVMNSELFFEIVK